MDQKQSKNLSARSGSFFSFQRCFWCFFEETLCPFPPLISWSVHGFRLQGEDYIHLLSLSYTLIAERRDSDSVFVDWPLGTLDEGHFTPDRGVPTSVVKKFPWVYPSLSVHRSDFPIISLLNPTTKYYNFLFEKGIGSHHKWPIKSYSISGWWFQTFFMFHNTLDNFSHWLTHIFQDGKNHQPDMLYSDISIVWLQLTGATRGRHFRRFSQLRRFFVGQKQAMDEDTTGYQPNMCHGSRL